MKKITKKAQKKQPNKNQTKKQVKEQAMKPIATPQETPAPLEQPSPVQTEALVSSTGGALVSEITLNRDQVEQTLRVCRDFTGMKNTLPILSNVHITAEADRCAFAVTDLDVSWTTDLPCTTTGKADRCVPLEIFYAEVRAIERDKGNQVTLSFFENTIMVNGRCDIYTMPGSEYPELPTITGEEVSVPGIASAFRTVLPAVANHDARYTLNGVYLDFAKGRIVGTDGHRLHLAEMEKQERKGIIVPRRAAEIMEKHLVLGTLTIGKDNRFSSKLLHGTMTARLIDGNFPNYEQVMPLSSPIRVEFNVKDMLKVFEGALPIANEKTHAVKFVINGKIEVHAQSTERGTYSWSVPAKTEGKPKTDILAIGFNAYYLKDAFSAYTAPGNETVIMELTNALSPCVINHMAVVMPVRV